jgi:probable DNA metabolism protein
MQTISYDSSFHGFLTTVFEIYEYKFQQPDIQKESTAKASLFSADHKVYTNVDKAKRVFDKLQFTLSFYTFSKLQAAFLSEQAGIENVLFRFIQHALNSKKNIEGDYSHPDVLTIEQVSKRVFYEAQRMTGFVRFQQANDGLYFSVIEPDNNILPLITHHFKERFANQRWLIYDQKRNYGIYYDLRCICEVNIKTECLENSVGLALHEDEVLYQTLWKKYFKTTYSSNRKNTKLHVQLLPRRYWKHLTEKMMN